MSTSNYAIHYAGSAMIARTPDGAFHIYPSQKLAELAAKELGDGYEVRPYGHDDEEG